MEFIPILHTIIVLNFKNLLPRLRPWRCDLFAHIVQLVDLLNNHIKPRRRWRWRRFELRRTHTRTRCRLSNSRSPAPASAIARPLLNYCHIEKRHGSQLAHTSTYLLPFHISPVGFVSSFRIQKYTHVLVFDVLIKLVCSSPAYLMLYGLREVFWLFVCDRCCDTPLSCRGSLFACSTPM